MQVVDFHNFEAVQPRSKPLSPGFARARIRIPLPEFLEITEMPLTSLDTPSESTLKPPVRAVEALWPYSNSKAGDCVGTASKPHIRAMSGCWWYEALNTPRFAGTLDEVLRYGRRFKS